MIKCGDNSVPDKVQSFAMNDGESVPNFTERKITLSALTEMLPQKKIIRTSNFSSDAKERKHVKIDASDKKC